MRLDVKKVVYLGFLIAVGVVLKLVRLNIPFLGLSFTGFPMILAGILFGPISGAIVGGLIDFLGFVFRPIGPFMPHFILTAALTGAIPGIVMLFFKGKSLEFRHYFLAISIGQIITSVLLVPYFISLLFGVPFKIKFCQALVTQSYHIIFYSFIIKIIVDRVNSLKLNFEMESFC